MRDIIYLLFHLLTTVAKLLQSGGSGTVLATIGHAKDSLWSRDAGPVDLFRCESILLKSHWVMVVMDQYTRRIIGFAVHAGNMESQSARAGSEGNKITTACANVTSIC